MENGGNAKVNAIFEARLREAGVAKPAVHADGPTRERYIRDKYERRKFYDPAGFAITPTVPSAISRSTSSSSAIGGPSEAARLRIEERQVRKSVSAVAVAADDSDEGERKNPPRRTVSASSRGGRRTVNRSPASAPVDLLDLSSDSPPQTVPSSDFEDVFGANNASSEDQIRSGRTVTVPIRRSRSRSAEKEDIKPPAPAPSSYSQDIMSLYNAAPQQATMGYNSVANMTNMVQNMNIQNNGNIVQNAMMYQQQMMVMQNQQQQQQMMMMQAQGNNNMLMMQGNSYAYPQQQSNNSNTMPSYNESFGSVPMGSGPSLSSMAAQGQTSMNSSSGRAAPEKEDPFAQFGLNVFRS